MAEAPPLLDSTVVTNIVSFLEANGGALPLGKVTRQFRGVKKAQLSEFFVVTVGANPNDPVISINELSGQQLADAVARAAQPAGAGPPAIKAEPAPVEVAPLDGGRVMEITSFLEANGGALSLGKLARQFRGVKKAQLEKHFFVEVEEGAPDFVVSLNPRGGGGGQQLPQRPAVLPGELPPAAVPSFGGNMGAPSGLALATAPGRPEVPPLQPAAVQRVAAALADNGGSMSLGKLTRTFPGVKKAQLMRHFAVVHDGTQGPVVQLPGGGVHAAPRPARAALVRRGPGNGGLLIRPHAGFRAPPFRGPTFGVGPPMALPSRGTPQQGDSAAIEQLAPARLTEVTSFIQNNEGSVSLGRLTRQFRGLKKAQLIAHFNIHQHEGDPDLCVSLHNAVAGIPVARKRTRTEAFGGEKAPGEEPPALDAGKVAEMTAFLEASGGSLPLGKMTREFRGVKKPQLAQHFTMTVTENPQDPVVSVGEPNLAALSDLAVGSSQKRARRAAKEEPQDVEVPPLDTLRLAEITALLVSSGGPVPLGKLTRQFPGVKKTQLEQHLTLTWEAGQRDFVVGLSEAEQRDFAGGLPDAHNTMMA